jgi:hypothetical protein
LDSQLETESNLRGCTAQSGASHGSGSNSNTFNSTSCVDSWNAENADQISNREFQIEPSRKERPLARPLNHCRPYHGSAPEACYPWSKSLQRPPDHPIARIAHNPPLGVSLALICLTITTEAARPWLAQSSYVPCWGAATLRYPPYYQGHCPEILSVLLRLSTRSPPSILAVGGRILTGVSHRLRSGPLDVILRWC